MLCDIAGELRHLHLRAWGGQGGGRAGRLRQRRSSGSSSRSHCRLRVGRLCVVVQRGSVGGGSAVPPFPPIVSRRVRWWWCGCCPPLRRPLPLEAGEEHFALRRLQAVQHARDGAHEVLRWGGEGGEGGGAWLHSPAPRRHTRLTAREKSMSSRSTKSLKLTEARL